MDVEDKVKTFVTEDLVSDFIVASGTLLVYDYCLILDMECRLIWRRPFTWFNVLYLIQKYLPLLDTVIPLSLGVFFSNDHSKNYCDRVFSSSLWMHVVGTALSEVILSLRIWAIARHRVHRLAYIIVASFVLAWGVVISAGASWAKVRASSRSTLNPQTQIQGCLIEEKGFSMLVLFGVLELYESGGFVLLVCATFSTYKHRRISRLYGPLYLSGILQYIIMFILFVVEVLVTVHISAELIFVIMPLTRVLHSISTCRIVLQIREATENPVIYYGDNHSFHIDAADELGGQGGHGAMEFALNGRE